MIYEFDDQYGRHSHLIQGPPYDFKAPITCETCRNIIRSKRAAMVKKYNWSEWPESISVAKDI